MVKKSVGSMRPPAKSRSAEANFSPTPVLVTTPMMIPAEAQATKTPKTFFAPASKPLTISMGFMRVDFLRKEAQIERTMAKSAARMGV